MPLTLLACPQRLDTHSASRLHWPGATLIDHHLVPASMRLQSASSLIDRRQVPALLIIKIFRSWSSNSIGFHSILNPGWSIEHHRLLWVSSSGLNLPKALRPALVLIDLQTEAGP